MRQEFEIVIRVSVEVVQAKPVKDEPKALAKPVKAQISKYVKKSKKAKAVKKKPGPKPKVRLAVQAQTLQNAIDTCLAAEAVPLSEPETPVQTPEPEFKTTKLEPGEGLEYAKQPQQAFRNYPAKKGGKHADLP